MSAVSGNPAPFAARVAVGLAIVGGLLLLALVAMIGFGNEIEQRTTRVPGPTAKGATGFQALHDMLARLPGTTVTLARTDADLRTDVLLIATPDQQTRPADLGALIDKRDFRPTLIILPKWKVERDGLSSTREQRVRGALGMNTLGTMLRDVTPVAISRDAVRIRRPVAPNANFAPIEQPQTITGKALDPWIAVRGQGAILAKIGDRRTWVLADPDIANNYGMRDARNARSITAAIAAMNDGRLDGVAFDLTLHYRPGERNLVKLMLTPPFIAVTIALIAAGILAGWASAARFGPPRREARAIPFGKAALIDNIAMLTRRARRVAAGGARFADARAERLGARLHAPPHLRGRTLAEWLDTRRPGFAARYGRTTIADDDAALLAAGQALDDFTKEKA